MNEQYEKLRQVIIAANPEIVELKFGCMIRWNDGSLPDSPITGVEPMSDGDWEVSWGCFNPDLSEPRYKILGRPIRLSDILLADMKRIDDVTNIKRMRMELCPPSALRILANLDLHHDDLDWHFHNKPETVQFLIDLLVK